MQTRQRAKRGDRLIAAHLVVFAFLFLALCVTAAGTARFAVALGYSEWVGYAVGGVLEVGKWVLPILVMSLWHARLRVLACLIGIACLGLVTLIAHADLLQPDMASVVANGHLLGRMRPSVAHIGISRSSGGVLIASTVTKPRTSLDWMTV